MCGGVGWWWAELEKGTYMAEIWARRKKLKLPGTEMGKTERSGSGKEKPVDGETRGPERG